MSNLLELKKYKKFSMFCNLCVNADNHMDSFLKCPMQQSRTTKGTISLKILGINKDTKSKASFPTWLKMDILWKKLLFLCIFLSLK